MRIFNNEVDPLLMKSVETMTQLALARGETSAQDGLEALKLAEITQYVSIFFGVVLLIVVIVISILIPRNIAKPILQLKERMDLLANGDLNNKPLETNSRDEIGMLVHSANQVNENLKDMLLKISEVSETLSNQSYGLTHASQEVKEGSNQIANSLLGGYEEVEAGKSKIINTGKTFEQIEQSLSQMTNGIQTISQSLSSIANNSDTMNKSISEIASISEESAAGIEETSASVEQSSKSMEEVATSAVRLNELANNLKQLIGRFVL
ncbi:HAMP domain-containing protein [Metabacillus malikii]|uniref:Methyl-accepting chemotaxis protein n=1 Tax=Metabacillus malikii TaxID=1504265 RepID=A0ABT9ZEM2_9BACI|nr:methyl-accepting chemotaxis protein [Metabacillus malikii]MDQ0230698.1 methyl-accepting chemotaxis protein [Metabacillus malikii]